ncbi:helix-turn-helix domain-containing protein [Streptomyces sp. NPDC059785]|uniref:helix-turn-helix domain-containing protein n=1 Tax=unclassified Streptomyces TaxID=2593676 RepID=UPI00365403D2
MDTQHDNAHPYPRTGAATKNHSSRRPSSGSDPHPAGVTHDNTRHATHFTVIGNHLAQHRELSGLAIGLGVYIQSLPTGAKVDIKTLAARFPEGTTRIANALRELEEHGYLRRTRERTATGRIVTRTVSCNQPGRSAAAGPPEPPPRRPPAATPQDKPRRRALPAVPQPATTSPALLLRATEVVATLRRHDPRLLLSETETAHLAPGVAAWLERDLTPTAVREALTSGLPSEPLHRPAALLAHRLTAQLPPPPPYRTPAPPPPAIHPMRNCDGCDRSIRAAPGVERCRDCRTDPPESA